MNDDVSPTDPLLAEAARAARPYLSELAGQEAEKIDEEIAALLESARDGADVTEALSVRLERPETLRDWVATFLDLGRPADIARPPLRGYPSVPGTAQEITSRRFVCPAGDYVWYSSGLVRTPPECPTHKVPLVAADLPGTD